MTGLGRPESGHYSEIRGGESIGALSADSRPAAREFLCGVRFLEVESRGFFLKCRVSMEEFDLDTHHVVVVLATIVTAATAVELTLWRAISDAQRRTDRRDCIGLGHDQ